MSKWPEVPFEEAVLDVSGGNAKTPQSEFLQAGAYPVVDQGSSLIAGYTNDEARLCRADLPVIVFGDHTRHFKYIDFPFCIGADGVKVLRPRPGLDAKYLFHYLRRLKIQGGGYSRHFKYLKRHPVVVAPDSEQHRIADVLDRADELRAKRRAGSEKLGSLKQAIFSEMFGDPIEHAKAYPVESMIALIDPDRPITYGILKPGEHVEDGVRYVRVVDIQAGRVVADRLRRTSMEIAASYKRSTLAAGDVLLSIRGHVGRLAAVPAELAGSNITQDTARLALVGVDPTYVIECLRTPAFQRWMARHTKGAAVRGINLGDVKRMPVPVPPRGEQEAFSERAAAVDALAAKSAAARVQSDALFDSVQHLAFAGAL